MKLRLYSIYDVKSMIYHQPFPANTDEQAKRAVTVRMMENPKLEISNFPEDFQLRKICAWNNSSGEIDKEEEGKHICDLVELANTLFDMKRKEELQQTADLSKAAAVRDYR